MIYPAAKRIRNLTDRRKGRAKSERLRQIIKELQRHRFGGRAETLPEEQMLLGLEQVEQAEASGEARQDENASGTARLGLASAGLTVERCRRLPRIEMVVDIDDKTCRCCKGELHQIGVDKSERLDMAPAQFRVLVTIRPKYACRSCEEGVIQAPAPARLIEGGMRTEATIAQVLVSKYADQARRLASASAARAPSYEAQELRQIVRG
jgi:transposase